MEDSTLKDTDSAYIPLLQSVVPKPTPFYFDTNIIDNYLFFWVNKFVNVPTCFSFENNFSKLANKRSFQQDDHWNLRKQETSEGITNQLSATFHRNKVKTRSLVKSIFLTNKGENFFLY